MNALGYGVIKQVMGYGGSGRMHLSLRSVLKRSFAIGFVVLTLLLLTIACSPGKRANSPADLVIGSKNFTEQVILGELLAQHVETTLGLRVDRRFSLGGSFICHQALLAGQLDAYIEYTGTALTTILKQPPLSDPRQVYQQVQQGYGQQFSLEVTEPLGFENTFAMIIRGDDARRYGIQTLSQVAQHTPQWQAGFGYEFTEREDGFPGLAKVYGLRFAKSPRIMDLGLLYRALVDKKVDMVAGNSTDGQIGRLGLVILQDDKRYFPPYEAVPIVRRATLETHPALRQALQQLGNQITAADMQAMNYQVEAEFRPVAEVARAFLQSKSLNSKSLK